MLIDITLKVLPKMVTDANGNEKITMTGHLGTHFDVMNKEFPLEFTERKAVVFDVTDVPTDREITPDDIDMSLIEADMFVAFYSGFIEKEEYGTKTYFSEHPVLSTELIDALLEKKISIIGVDFAGVRRGKEHTPMDQYCADRGVFVIENLCNLGKLDKNSNFTACTYPMNFAEMTGLPCRVIAKTEDC